jgi:hypothetical protein
MTSREIVRRTVDFNNAERMPIDFPEKFGSDFISVNMDPTPDDRPHNRTDEWGALWENIGVCNLGEVKEFPLKDWAQFDDLMIPDISEDRRWEHLSNIRSEAGDKYILGFGISLYERVHFIRGLENTWIDIYENAGNLGRLIDILVDMNLYAIERYAGLGVDGYLFPDDWGLQNRLMISPDSWREIWKPRYAKIYKAAHEAGMQTYLHSCGYIVDILDDLIEIGLDVIQMDQQENMGIELLGEKFGGRITFYCPVDIQNTMVKGSLDDIRQYCRRMTAQLGRPDGGFIPKWYSDPVGAGHREEAIDAMCEEFLKIIEENGNKE